MNAGKRGRLFLIFRSLIFNLFKLKIKHCVFSAMTVVTPLDISAVLPGFRRNCQNHSFKFLTFIVLEHLHYKLGFSGLSGGAFDV